MTEKAATAGAIVMLVSWLTALVLMLLVLVSGCTVTSVDSVYARRTTACEEQSDLEFPPICQDTK